MSIVDSKAASVHATKGDAGFSPAEESQLRELLPVSNTTVRDSAIPTVDARKLHVFLEIGKDFSTWVKDRIAKYGFVENVDFVKVFDSPDLGNQTGRGGDRRSVEYHLTLGTAKELAMVENNPQGRRARRYFIACEERLHSQDPMEVFSDPAKLRIALLDYAARMQAAETQIKEMAPKVEVHDLICAPDDTYTPTDAAKQIDQPPRVFHAWLIEHKWLKRHSDGNAVPLQDKINRGLMTFKQQEFTKLNGEKGYRAQAQITHKGLCQVTKEIYAEYPDDLLRIMKRLGGGRALVGRA